MSLTLTLNEPALEVLKASLNSYWHHCDSMVDNYAHALRTQTLTDERRTEMTISQKHWRERCVTTHMLLNQLEP